MSPVRRAVIDVGTNSVKLLAAVVAGRCVDPVWEGSHQTRLGRGFYESHRLQPGPIQETARTVAEFAGKAREMGVVDIRVIATSAARDAVNGSELVSAIHQASGLQTEIIDGQQEAEMAYHGAATNPVLADLPLLLLDVGGGSTEFILGRQGRILLGTSCPLGTVRLLERMPPSDPPAPAELAACRTWVRGFLDTEVRSRLAPVLGDGNRALSEWGWTLVGTGGTASILGCMECGLQVFDRERLETTRISSSRLESETARLWQMPLAERRQIVGLPPNRADVILMGAVVFEAVAERFGCRELRVSTRGLRYGALLGPTKP